MTTCIITKKTPIQLAHLIPYDENDSASNIIPLRYDLHKSFDDKLWAFDPNGFEPSKEDEKLNNYSSNKYKNYKIVISSKCPDTETIKEYDYKLVPIFDISIPFIEESWKRFNEKNSPTV